MAQAPDYTGLYQGAAQASNVDPLLLRAIAQQESDEGQNTGPSSAGARGVMQFIPETAARYGVNVNDAKSSIYGAGRYMDDLLQYYGGELHAALSAYGGDASGKAGYANSVLAHYRALQKPATASPFLPGSVPGTENYLAGSNIDEIEKHVGEPLSSVPDASGDVHLTPDEHALLGGGTPSAQTPPAAPHVAQSDKGATTLSPDEHALLAPQSAPQKPPETAPAPARPPAQPASAEPPVPPIYTAPTTPLIGKEALPQTMPATPPGGVPAITSENLAAIAGFEHGARQAVNPLLEFGSAIGNRIAGAIRLPIQTDRAANDAAAEAAFQQQYGNNPIATGAATGARVGLPLVAGGALGTAARAGLEVAGLPRVASFISGAGSTPSSGVVNRLASGATAGGWQGLLTGGPWGAVTGTGLGVALQPIGTAANALYSRFAPEAAAAQRIFQALVRDGMTPEAAAAGVQRLGGLGTLADLEQAPNLRQLAEGVANTPGPGQQVAAANIIPRGEGQQARLEQSIAAATGNPRSAFQETQDLLQQRSAAARPAYENAFNNTPIRMQASAQLAPYIDTPIGQRALQDGIANARLEAVRAGQPFNLEDYGVQQNPDGSMQIIPSRASLRTYDAVKRGYDQLAEGLRDPTSLRMNYSGTIPVPGGGNISANNVIGARNDVTRILRNSYPEYAQALDAWGGPSADLDALRLGRGILTQDAEQTADNVARLSPSQREMYQAGIAQTLRDTVARTPDDANAVRRIFGNSLYRERIAAGFGGEDTPAFQQFRQDMENEAVFAQTQRRMFGGPDTARRLAAINLAQGGGINLTGPAMHLITGNPMGAVADVGHQLVTPLVNRLVQPSDRVSLALGNMLFNPAARGQALNMLTARPGPSVRDVLLSPWGQATVQALANSRQRARGPVP